MADLVGLAGSAAPATRSSTAAARAEERRILDVGKMAVESVHKYHWVFDAASEQELVLNFEQSGPYKREELPARNQAYGNNQPMASLSLAIDFFHERRVRLSAISVFL